MRLRQRLGGIGEAFADRNFRLYSVGSIVSWITYFVQQIAFSWAAWELTRSPAWLAAIVLLDALANVLLLPFGGALADRIDRLRMVVTAYGFDFLKALVLTVLAFTGQLTLPVLCVCAVLHGVIHAFSVPASYGMMPRFVARERLPAAIAVSASYTQFAIFAGPAIAGWILVHGGVAAAFATNVAGYLVYFATVCFLRTPEGYRQSRSDRRSFLADVPEGARYILRHGGIRALLAMMLAGDALLATVYQLMPAYSDTLLGAGIGGVSILLGTGGLGATLAALWLAHGGSVRTTPLRVFWAFLLFTLAVGGLAASPALLISVPLMLIFGFAGETARTATLAILQTTVDDAQRGRVMSTRFLLQRAAGGLGALAVGGFAQTVGMRLPMLVVAAVALAAWGIAWTGRSRILAAFDPADEAVPAVSGGRRTP
ncbi:MFS transporter [Labrys wisconsinensis]|uniref:MFS family permease n=1 Tax=Labrys wisconsinensis TaxID=425677 RepID=A0ABU0JFX8_9HYPH|nr:MFS transporter [Labrys wisconsinensis]MDQ0472037.1 MFS family permease [Labrys wisconsinensis]